MAEQAKRDLYEHFAEVGKALSSDRRLELLDLLAQGERGVDELSRTAGLGLTSVSAHLQSLRRAGLVTTRRDGTHVRYRLAGDDVAAMLDGVRRLAEARVPGTVAARRAYVGADDDGGVGIIDAEELLRRSERDEIIVLDVRPPAEFDQGHLPGAVSMPLETLADRLDEIPRGRTVVTYCRGRYCVFARDAARILGEHGIEVVRLAEGLLEWRLAGRPVETRPAA